MNNLLRRTLAALLITTATSACASSRAPAGELVSDRPDATESALAVAPGYVQLEAGYTLTTAGGDRTHTVGEVLARVGLTPAAELRLGLNSFAIVEPAVGPTVTGLEDASLGAKVELPAVRFFPETAVLAGLSVPTGASELRGEWTPELIVASAWPVAPGVDAGVNVGWIGAPGGDELLATGALGVALAPRWGGYVEAYTFAAAETRSFVNGGFTFAWTDDLQLDLRAGTELGGAGERFVGAGLVARW